MAVKGSTKRRKMEENMRKRLERGAKKMAAKALRKEKKNA
jgi:hypothetical protein